MAKSGVLLVLLALAGCGGERALSRHQFCELVGERAEAALPGTVIGNVDERGLEYTLASGGQGRISIDAEYADYVRAPDQLDEIVARLVSLVAGHRRLEPLQQDREQIVRSILPVLRPATFLAEAEARAGQPLLHTDHPTGLRVFYVVDQPPSYSYMTTAALQGLGLAADQVSRLALSNLASRTGAGRFTVERTPTGPLAVGSAGDGYDASRLISPTLPLTLFRVLGTATAVVAIPRRDLMIAVPAGDPALLGQIRALARAEYETGPDSITPALFSVGRLGVEQLAED